MIRPCPCACNSGGFCGGCGHAGCGLRGRHRQPPAQAATVTSLATARRATALSVLRELEAELGRQVTAFTAYGDDVAAYPRGRLDAYRDALRRLQRRRLELEGAP